MKNRLIFTLILSATALLGVAQSSLPAPGSGGGFSGGNSLPGPGAGGAFTPNPGPGPGMPPPPSWGSPWNSGPGLSININAGDWTNSGTMTVMAAGYDSYGIWRHIPLRVAYSWNGVNYNVTVLAAWNPWSDMWNRGVDQQAFNVSYYTHGNTYDFYAPLSTGTYYFNL